MHAAAQHKGDAGARAQGECCLEQTKRPPELSAGLHEQAQQCPGRNVPLVIEHAEASGEREGRQLADHDTGRSDPADNSAP